MADKLSLMASHGYTHCFALHKDQGLGVFKDFQFQPFLPSYGAKQEIPKLESLKLMPLQYEEPWKLTSGLLETNWFGKTDSEVERHALNVQDVHPDSVMFSSGIAEHLLRHEKMMQFMSGESEAERSGLDITLLYDLMGLRKMNQQPLIPSLIYPSSEFNTQKPLLDFVANLAWSSKIRVQPDGRVFFTGTGTEMKHLLSVVSEFYSFRNSVCWKNQSLLVPHFNRVDSREARFSIGATSWKIQAATLAPLKSPEKVKTKATPKQRSGRKVGKDRDLYKRNYFHACESLLSLIVNNRRKRGKSAILSLKKSGPELPELLTQCSASIAGTGLALLLSVLCKVASGRVPFCASKLLNTGVALGLVWLSWAVNTLRDTVVHISKNSKKPGLKEEEIVKRVETSVNEIYFRAASLMAVAVLKLA